MDLFDIDQGIKASPQDKRKFLEKFDFTGFYQKMASTAVEGGKSFAEKPEDGIWKSVAGGVEAAFNIKKLPNDSGVLAFKLGLEAALAAHKTLIAEEQTSEADFSGLSLVSAIYDTSWSLYRNPRKIEFLAKAQEFKPPYRFADYFVRGLGIIAATQSRQYSLLGEDLLKALVAEGRQANRWIEHDNARIREVDEPLLGERCTLGQLFVKPLAYRMDQQEKIIDLWTDTLPQWIESTDKADCLRLIYGGPGAGKSSLTRMLAAELAHGTFPTRARCRSVRIPIHELGKPLQGTWNMVSLRDRLNDLQMVPFDVEQTGTFPLHGADRLVLVFDGLDELEALGGQGAEDASVLMETLRRLLSDLNSKDRSILGIVTGRDMVMEAVSQTGGDGKRKYHLTPYPTDPQTLPEGRDPLNEWWKNYQRAIDEEAEPQGVPQELLERQDLHEILAEPLLNFLMARALKRGIDPKTVSLNVLYAQFLEDVCERVWEQPTSEAHTPQHAHGFTLSQFRQVLSAVGVEIWHGGGIRGKKVAIAERCRNEKIVRAWEEVTERCTRDVAKLLMAFYLRHHNTEEDYGLESVEFTHKSFGEYLTALRIVAELDYAVKEPDTKTALISWVKLFGEQSMWNSGAQIFRFVEAEIKAYGETNPELVTEWQKRLAAFTEHVTVKGMPVDKVTPENRLPFQKELAQSKNAEESLLAILGVIWCVTKTFYEIPFWSGQHGYRPRAWLNRLLGDLDTTRSSVFVWPALLPCLQGLVSVRADLSGANLWGANLSGAFLQEANLSKSNLMAANLMDANLCGADLSAADLKDAEFRRAELERSYFSAADLRGAILSGADLTGAYLTEADLRGAYISEALCWSDQQLEFLSFKEAAKAEPGILPFGLSENVIARLRVGRNPE